MFNIQKDIIDQCQVILKLIDVVYDSSDDITVLMDRTDKIRNLKTSIANLMVKFEQLGIALNMHEEHEKLYSTIRLFENNIPEIKEILSGKTCDLPDNIKGISLDNVNKNVRLLEGKLESCIDEIRVNLKVLDTMVVREKVPSLSGIMGKLHGEETITEVQKAEMNENAMTIMMQINDSCNNVITNLENVTTLTIGAINYVTRYFELLTEQEQFSELKSLCGILKLKQNKIKEVLIS